MKKFWKEIDKVILGGLSAIVFLILGLFWWIFDPETPVPMWVVSVGIILCYFICIIIYGVCSVKKETDVYRLPMVKNIQKVPHKIIFIVEKNDLFNQGSYATICYQEEEESLEKIIGLGYVESINSAGYLQIVLQYTAENIDKNILKKLMIIQLL